MKKIQKPLKEWTTADIVELLKSLDKATWLKIGVSAAIALALFGFLIWPAWFKRVQVHAQIRNLQARIHTLEIQKQRQPEWERNKTEYRDYIERTQMRLYQPGESALLLGEIAKLAEESGVAIIASRPRQETLEFPSPFNKNYEAALYDFTVEGGYHALGTFVSKIEAYPRLLRIETFHIRPQDKMPERHLADLQLSVITYKKADGT